MKSIGAESAFACPADNHGGMGSGGLTIREYAAIACLQGLVANPGGPVQVNPMNGWGLTNCTFDHVAEFAVALADALISQLSEPK